MENYNALKKISKKLRATNEAFDVWLRTIESFNGGYDVIWPISSKFTGLQHPNVFMPNGTFSQTFTIPGSASLWSCRKSTVSLTQPYQLCVRFDNNPLYNGSPWIGISTDLTNNNSDTVSNPPVSAATGIIIRNNGQIYQNGSFTGQTLSNISFNSGNTLVFREVNNILYVGRSESTLVKINSTMAGSTRYWNFLATASGTENPIMTMVAVPY